MQDRLVEKSVSAKAREEEVEQRGLYLQCRLRRRGRLAMEVLVGLSIGSRKGENEEGKEERLPLGWKMGV